MNLTEFIETQEKTIKIVEDELITLQQNRETIINGLKQNGSTAFDATMEYFNLIDKQLMDIITAKTNLEKLLPLWTK